MSPPPLSPYALALALLRRRGRCHQMRATIRGIPLLGEDMYYRRGSSTKETTLYGPNSGWKAEHFWQHLGKNNQKISTICFYNILPFFVPPRA